MWNQFSDAVLWSQSVTLTSDVVELPQRKARSCVLSADHSEYSLAAVSRRLRQLREAFELTQTQLCRLTGINVQVWNNAETGDNMISNKNAVRLRAKFGVSLDWIFCGAMDALPQKLRDHLIQQSQPQRAKHEPASGRHRRPN